MQAALRDACRSEVQDIEGRRSDAVWGVTGVMSNGILPEGPDERRRRRRLCALRALDRLGLLGEENLIPTLARRPALRWLADEGGARWDVLIELGRIGEPGAFEEAVRWALENRPCTEEAKAYVWRLRSGTIGLPDVAKARRKPELSAINTRPLAREVRSCPMSMDSSGS